MTKTERDDDEAAEAPTMMQSLATQMQIVAMAEHVAHETLKALSADEGGTRQANVLAAQALDILTPDGGMRMVTMCAAAAVIASIVENIIQRDLQDGGGAMPSDALVMAISMIAQHVLRCDQQHAKALNNAVKADPNRAN